MQTSSPFTRWANGTASIIFRWITSMAPAWRRWSKTIHCRRHGLLDTSGRSPRQSSILDCLGDLPDVSSNPCRRQWMVFDQRGQAGAIDVIHRKIMLAVPFAHLVNGDDVCMNQVGRNRFSLRPKTTREGLAGKRKCLHGDNLIAADLARLVNHSRVAAADFR